MLDKSCSVWKITLWISKGIGETVRSFWAGLNDSDIKLLFENYATTFHAFKNHYFVIPNNTYSDLELQVYKETMHLDFITYDPADNHKELSEGLKELDAKVEDKKEEVKDKLWW